MTKQTTIPAGYRITITTWENDADNYKTEVMEGITDINLAKFYCELAELHTSRHDHRKKGFGNLYEPSEREIGDYFAAIDLLIKKYPDIQIYKGQPVTEADHVRDAIYELGLTGGDFFTRVCENIKVEYTPTDIVFNDVTEEFVK